MHSIAGLDWHEDLDAARADAAARGTPILSLRLLGRLDEELSCANSRLYRSAIYPRDEVRRLLGRRFVLHWRSVRPVPRIRVDFGDGRVLEQTVTGNSAHLVLDQHGRPVDAIPGLYPAAQFVTALEPAAEIARATTTLDGRTRTDALARHHAARRELLLRSWAEERRSRATPRPKPWPPTAREAGQIAMTKMAIERPILDAFGPLSATSIEDGLRNERRLHRKIHDRFVRGLVGDEPSFTRWIYQSLFKMPDDDPWLGLKSMLSITRTDPS